MYVLLTKRIQVHGNKAILCSVWPDHNVVIRGTKPTDGEDIYRGIDTRREPVDVFRMNRYINPKSYLAAKDEYRMTTPVSDKIDGWRKKYGTK